MLVARNKKKDRNYGIIDICQKGIGNAKQVEQLDTLIQDKGSKISDNML